ncbi:MOSC domain-containing protein [Lacrimispora indolis]|uniref:MOSC domain-containing protein n=1 Tax=Lacrimispora indolis TaxID=69825 RepID=UPI0003FF6E79|nr:MULTISPECIES: MOSC domain-containing protein [Lachnospiraceae]MBE7718789.1 MOSC domain-containing protein [Lacrimispora celerecrescens]
MGKVMAVCISERKGTQKTRVDEGYFIEEYGIEGDAHAGKWHRQVSLLSFDTIEDFKARGAEIGNGAFGENVIVQGIDLIHLPIGTRLACKDILLEVTQIGKECHSHCEIYKKMGECIMPTNGIFTRVLHGGIMKEGDEITVCTEEES